MFDHFIHMCSLCKICKYTWIYFLALTFKGNTIWDIPSMALIKLGMAWYWNIENVKYTIFWLHMWNYLLIYIMNQKG